MSIEIKRKLNYEDSFKFSKRSRKKIFLRILIQAQFLPLTRVQSSFLPKRQFLHCAQNCSRSKLIDEAGDGGASKGTLARTTLYFVDPLLSQKCGKGSAYRNACYAG